MKAKIVNSKPVVIIIDNSVYYALPIPCFQGYFATTDGCIISTISGRKTADSVATFEPKKLAEADVHGYSSVSLYRGCKRFNKRVNRLVAQTFLEEPDSYICNDGLEKERCQVNHIDGNKKNNALSNLEWVSAKENSRHYHEFLKVE